MEYEIGRRLDTLLEALNEGSIERTIILKVLEKVHKNEYKAALEETKKAVKG